MKNNVYTTPLFDKKFKKFKRKFPSLENEIDELIKELKQNPKQGIDLGANIYKIKLASKSKGKGKSGGFRIITYLIAEKKKETEIYLITIYDKSEDSNIRKQIIIKLIKSIFE
ncbi:MAG: type II toxin-antitoxin system RelE/ParE family toxin [Bacteroidetes bacterium]|nr:type II toxin-antitoxin system RelE/ParE family toxin [Bacteroidota bacterium]